MNIVLREYLDVEEMTAASIADWLLDKPIYYKLEKGGLKAKNEKKEKERIIALLAAPQGFEGEGIQRDLEEVQKEID